LSETGVPGFEVGGWYAVLAPAATPRDVVTRLNTEFTRALAQADVAGAIEKMGFEPAPMSLAESHQFVLTESEKWARSVRLSGAKAE
jgi:tripartite-type tricarboxylate transporter receptor subunit TctC